MSNPALNNSAIEKYRYDLELIRNTAAQIIKDFDLSGIEITFTGNAYTAYEELKAQLIPALANLYKNKRSVFTSLLYRIDVNENKVQKVLNHPFGQGQAEQISKLILEREFIKVLFKKLYS